MTRPLMRHDRPLASLTLLGLLCAAQAACAHEYAPLIRAKKYAEVDRATSVKLGTEPHNADALVARVDLILSQAQDHRYDHAVALAEQCITAHPRQSECHEALGNALGTKAMDSGILSAIGYATRIRDAFRQAVALDPNNLDARFSLLQYYLQAPGIVGGGKDHAQQLVAQTTQLHGEAARLMQARLDLADGAHAKAETAALSLATLTSQSLLDSQKELLISLGSKYVQDKKYADSQRVFQEIARRFVDSEWGPYGLARTLQEQGKTRDAVALFEQALTMGPGAHIYYRLAQCWQTLSDKSKAVAAYEKALDFKPALNKRQRSDARDQLKSLKG